MWNHVAGLTVMSYRNKRGCESMRDKVGYRSVSASKTKKTIENQHIFAWQGVVGTDNIIKRSFTFSNEAREINIPNEQRCGVALLPQLSNLLATLWKNVHIFNIISSKCSDRSAEVQLYCLFRNFTFMYSGISIIFLCPGKVKGTTIFPWHD